MSELDIDDEPAAPLVGPPSKRRRVIGNDKGSDSNVESPNSRDPSPRQSVSPGPKGEDGLTTQNLSIRKAPPSSLSPRRRVKREDSDVTDTARYQRPASHTSSPTPRSRSRFSQGRRDRSYSRSDARSGSRSRDYTPNSDRSHSQSRSRSRESFHSSRSRSRSTSSSRPQRAGASPLPLNATQIPNYQPHLRLTGHSGPVSQVRISPDGRWIASSSADGTAKIWDADTGAHMDTLIGHMSGVSCVAWAPDGNGLATGGDDKAIRLWDRVTASPAHAVGEGAGRGEENAFGTVRRRVNGGVLRGTGSGTGKGARGTRSGRGPLLGHHNYVYCLAFSPKGNILASGSYDEAVFLWDVRAGRLMRSLPAHSDPVSGIDFSRDGTLVASCSTDGLIRIWDTSTGQCLRTLVHEDNPAVTNVCFSPNGRFVLAFNLDNCIRLWDYVSGTVKKTYQGHKNSGFSIGGCFGVLTDDASCSDGSTSKRSEAFVTSASEDGDIVMWDVKSKGIVQRISEAHNGVCFWVDVHGDTMASAGQDGIIHVFRSRRASKGRPANGVDGHEADGLNGSADDGATPDAGTADEELQRQVEAGASATPVKIEDEEL